VKINSGWPPFGKGVKRADPALAQQIHTKSFPEMMQQQEDQTTQDQLRRKLEQIKLQGDRLARSMNVRELRSYRQLVKQFLEETARKGIAIKDSRGWDLRGRGKHYKLLEELDRKLLDMADELLDHEQGKIKILNDIGEIKGMLMNLLF
jgi:uncharacterized protein YaaR (DUF327 family)